jgi:hypothetical protein
VQLFSPVVNAGFLTVLRFHPRNHHFTVFLGAGANSEFSIQIYIFVSWLEQPLWVFSFVSPIILAEILKNGNSFYFIDVSGTNSIHFNFGKTIQKDNSGYAEPLV